MINKQLEITLLSDCCVSEGMAYNSAIDTDVCYDEYGLPYIPARRLKGIIRETALELNDWGENIDIIKLFGKEGDGKASVRIGNAYIDDYRNTKEYLRINKDKEYAHPQNVLSLFTYVRHQTEIDSETGTAKKTSLRSIRVIKKGYVFYSNISIDENLIDDFIKCAEATISIGMNRTRGLGDIRVRVLDAKEEIKQNIIDLKEGSNYLSYRISLEEPMILKSVQRGETLTMDYIEGSKILGLIINTLKKNYKQDEIDNLLDNKNLFVSNAYLQVNGKRGVEIPHSYKAIKNNKKQYIDDLCIKTQSFQDKINDKQIVSIKHCYINKNENHNIVKKSVKTEIRNHHKRPENKAIGHSIKSDAEVGLYQLDSIAAGQVFEGFITCDSEQLKLIKESLENLGYIYLGNSNSAEYGKSVLQLLETRKNSNTTLKARGFMVKLESPAIVYGDNATYSTKHDDLLGEIDFWLHLDKKAVKRKYIDYIDVGGYNVTWKKRKPTITAFDKGSVIYYEFDQEKELVIEKNTYLGERISEGFGEISVIPIDLDVKIDNLFNICDEQYTNNINNCLKPVIEHDLLLQMDRKRIKNYAMEKTKDKKYSANERSVVCEMLSMLRNSNSFEKVCKTIDEKYEETNKSGKVRNNSEISRRKKEYSDLIIYKINEGTEQILTSLNDHDGIDKENAKTIFAQEYLSQIKYQIRGNKEVADNE